MIFNNLKQISMNFYWFFVAPIEETCCYVNACTVIVAVGFKDFSEVNIFNAQYQT